MFIISILLSFVFINIASSEDFDANVIKHVNKGAYDTVKKRDAKLDKFLKIQQNKRNRNKKNKKNKIQTNKD